MADFYTAMQGVATSLLTRFKQGVITYSIHADETGDDWDPEVWDVTTYTLNGTAKGVSDEYVDGKTILASDYEVTTAVFDVTPTVIGSIAIDGEELQIVKLWQVPAAGTPVAWKFIVRA